MPSKTFKEVVAALRTALNGIFNREAVKNTLSNKIDEVKSTLSNKLAILNQRPLRMNTYALISHYRVSVADIQEDIKPLIKLRNAIVHEGHKAESGLQQPLSYYAAVLRELLTRIFLSMLQYRGEYQSYLDGPAWKQFPPIGDGNTI